MKEEEQGEEGSSWWSLAISEIEGGFSWGIRFFKDICKFQTHR